MPSSQRNVFQRNALLDLLRNTSRDNKALLSTQLYDVFFALDETSRYSITNSVATVSSDVTRGLLLQILERDSSPLVRHEAAFALGCVGNVSCRVALRKTLINDESFLVRHEAAMALGELGTLDDIPALTQGLQDNSKEVVISCEVALNRVLERVSAENPDTKFQ